MARSSAPESGADGAGSRLAPVVPLPLPVRHRRSRQGAFLARVLDHLRPAPPAGAAPPGRPTHPSTGAPGRLRAVRLPDDAA